MMSFLSSSSSSLGSQIVEGLTQVRMAEKDCTPTLTMVLVQVGFAGLNIVSKLALDSGMSPYVMTAYRQLVATLALAPIAFLLERKTCMKITRGVIFQIFLCSLFGATGNQILYLMGLQHTTPTIGSALTNMSPAITFILAIPFRTLSNNKWTEVEILRLAAGVESNTNHPVGKGILEAARAAGCHNVKATDGTFREEPGSGAVATVERRLVTVGTLNWLRRNGVVHKPLPETELDYQSIVYVGIDGDLAGLIYFEDKIREDAREVVDSLSKQGISIYMLSGDKKSTAEYVASIVGIPKDKVLSEFKPEEKKNFISELQKNQNVVAMVGDGINDAAALATSDVGIAMGEGVGAASDASSIVLMGNRLSQLIDALELSKMTMKTVKQNLWWAFAYNIVGIPIAAGILLPVNGTILTPSIAGALMGLSSAGVMANSLLLRLKLASKHRLAYNFKQETRPQSTSAVGSEKFRSA